MLTQDGPDRDGAGGLPTLTRGRKQRLYAAYRLTDSGGCRSKKLIWSAAVPLPKEPRLLLDVTDLTRATCSNGDTPMGRGLLLWLIGIPIPIIILIWLFGGLH
jgi:hypothetical protein